MAQRNTALALAAPPRHKEPMLTGAQIRSARALLKWTTKSLADKAKVGQQTVHRAEAVDDVPGMNSKTLEKIQLAFEEAGVEFVDGRYSGDGGPGVRLRK